MKKSTPQMEKYIDAEDGETIVDVLRRTTDVVEELMARPYGTVTHIDIGYADHLSAAVTFRPDLDE